MKVLQNNTPNRVNQNVIKSMRSNLNTNKEKIKEINSSIKNIDQAIDQLDKISQKNTSKKDEKNN